MPEPSKSTRAAPAAHNSRARLATHAQRPQARHSRPLADGCRDHRHRARPCEGQPLERPDKGLYPMSVAQHSVMVERFVSQNAPKLDTRWRLAALLHDAPEYVIGDMITPFKYALGGSTARSNHTLRGDPHPVWPACRSAGTRVQGHQARRPDGGMAGGNTACGVQQGRCREDTATPARHAG